MGNVNLVFRLLWLRLTAGRRSPLGMFDISRPRMRARLSDLDQIGHVNNGVYFSMMDLGRVDLLWRSGFWQKPTKAGWYPVVASQTITYRKPLR